MNLSRFYKNNQLASILFYLVILIIIDNAFLQNLQSPESLLNWLAKVFKDPTLQFKYYETGSVIPGAPSWIDSLIYIVATILLWIFTKKRFLYIPLILYTAWITFWLIIAVAILSANLWNPNSGATVILSDAFLLWISSIVVFAIWYWILDHDNQERHTGNKKYRVHFMFPQKMEPIPGWEKWIPGFIDYLFLSFNTSTAFGASEAVILTRKAKLLIILQSMISMIMFIMIAARAVNLI